MSEQNIEASTPDAGTASPDAGTPAIAPTPEPAATPDPQTASPETTTEANVRDTEVIKSPTEEYLDKVSGTKEKTDDEILAEAVGRDPEAVTDPEKYVQNSKFKVMDQEYEFDDFVKKGVIDSESESRARELYEKAYGLDHIKPKYQEIRTKYKDLETTHQNVMSDIGEMGDFYNRGDFDSFFKKLDIPQEKVLQWVLEKAKYQELEPEQRAAIDNRQENERRVHELEKQNNQLQTHYETQVTQAKANALSLSLDRPDVRAAAQAYDSRVGTPGAFRNEVISRGEMAWHQRQVDITPDQAIQEALMLTGYTPEAQGQASPGNGMQNQNPQSNGVQGEATQKKPVASERPPSIPNVGGKSTGALKPSYTSIDQLKQRYDQIR